MNKKRLAKIVKHQKSDTVLTVGREGSQYGEDKIVEDLLPQEFGWYVDVGAGEPVECNNTWRFYQKGWRGLLIDCLPSIWYPIMRQRPGDFLCPLAVTDRTGIAVLSMDNSLSSIQPNWEVRQDAKKLDVECDTLSNILLNFPTIRNNCQLLSIDVEGSEFEVLRGIDWDTFRPEVIIIEAFKYRGNRKPVKDMSKVWGRLLEPLYELYYQNKLNKIFRCRER